MLKKLSLVLVSFGFGISFQTSSCWAQATNAAQNVTCQGSCDFIKLPKRLIGDPKPIPALNTLTGQPIEIKFDPNYIDIGNVKIKKSAVRSLASINLSDYRLRVHGLPANTRISYTLYFIGNSGQLSALQFDILDPSFYYQFNDSLSDWYPTLVKTEIAPRIRDCGEVRFSENGTSTSLPPKPGACASGVGLPSSDELLYLDKARGSLNN